MSRTRTSAPALTGDASIVKARMVRVGRKNIMTELTAVKAGTEFNLLTKSELAGVALKPEGVTVRVDGVDYPLMCGATFTDSQHVDMLLDLHGGKPVAAYETRED